MDKQLLEKLINENKSSYEIAKEVGKSQTTVKYWLKKYNLKTNFNKHNLKSEIINNCKICTECNVNKNLTEYHYHNKDKTQYAAKCKTCRNNADVLKMRQLKDIFLKYKGEQCSVCGYNKCKGALEFHHLDPNEKEFNISDYKKIGINKEVLEELDRCIVLCSNCHRETHYND